MWLPHYIPDFMQQHPEIKLSIKGRDEEIDFTKHPLDVAISTALPPRENLIQNYLMTFHLGLYASPDYLEKFGIPKRLEDLKNHKMISHDKNTIHQFGKEINKILYNQSESKSSTEPALEMNMGASLVTVASKGLGIISVSKEYPGLQQSGLVQVLPEVENEVDIYYIFQEHMKKIQKILALETYLKTTLKSYRTKS
jgi:DNA-binding transcriptional LysR family regulator